MGWPALATIIICAVVMAGAFASVLETVLFHSGMLTRTMGSFSEMRLDCRGLAPARWARGVQWADRKRRGAKVPVRAFAFVEKSDASKVTCDDGASCLDYGVALGYSKAPGKPVSYQLSYVLYSEKVKGASRSTETSKQREKTLWTLTRMLMALEAKSPDFAGMQVENPFIDSAAEKFLPDDEAYITARWVPAPSMHIEEQSGLLKREGEGEEDA